MNRKKMSLLFLVLVILTKIAHGIQVTGSFRLGRWEGVFYGNPNGHYQVEIPTLKNNEPIKFDKAEIPVIWLGGSDDLHRSVLTYYKDYNNFLEEHYFDFAAEKAIGKEEQRVHI